MNDVVEDKPWDAVLGCYYQVYMAARSLLEKSSVRRGRGIAIHIADSIGAAFKCSIWLTQQRLVGLRACLKRIEQLER